MRWLCLVRRGLVSAHELVEGITTELVQGLVQPHEKWLPGRRFLRDREIGLFGFVRLLSSPFSLSPVLACSGRLCPTVTVLTVRNETAASLSVEGAWVELARRGLDRQGQQGGDQGQRRVAQGLQTGDRGHAARLSPELESQERGGLAPLGGGVKLDLAAGKSSKGQRRRVSSSSVSGSGSGHRAPLQERNVSVIVVRDDQVVEAVTGVEHDRRYRVEPPEGMVRVRGMCP